jgi:hypothetical protein
MLPSASTAIPFGRAKEPPDDTVDAADRPAGHDDVSVGLECDPGDVVEEAFGTHRRLSPRGRIDPDDPGATKVPGNEHQHTLSRSGLENDPAGTPVDVEGIDPGQRSPLAGDRIHPHRRALHGGPHVGQENVAGGELYLAGQIGHQREYPRGDECRQSDRPLEGSGNRNRRQGHGEPLFHLVVRRAFDVPVSK